MKPKQKVPLQRQVLDLLEMLTGSANWVYRQVPNKDAFEFEDATAVEWTDEPRRLLFTGQSLTMVEYDPRAFLIVLEDKLRQVGMLTLKAAKPDGTSEHAVRGDGLREPVEFAKTVTVPTEQGNPGIGVPPGHWTRDTLAFRVMGNNNEPIRVRPGEIRDLFHSQTLELQKRIQELEATVGDQAAGVSHWIPETTATALELKEDQRILQRAEAIELTSAMLANAGFTLLRDAPGETAMWQQKLESRPGVQVFFLLTVPQQELAPAELFTLVRSQVGVA